MRVFILLFVLFSTMFVGWKLMPQELKSMIGEGAGKVAFPIVKALILVVALLALALSFNVKVI